MRPEAAQRKEEPGSGQEGVEQSLPVPTKQTLVLETKEFLVLLKQHREWFQPDADVVPEESRKLAALNVAAQALRAVDELAAAAAWVATASDADAAFAAVVAVERANLKPAAAFAAEASEHSAQAYSNSVAVAHPEVAFAADSRAEERNLREAWMVAAENLAAAHPSHDGVEHFRANFPKDRRVQVHRKVHDHKVCCNRK